MGSIFILCLLLASSAFAVTATTDGVADADAPLGSTSAGVCAANACYATTDGVITLDGKQTTSDGNPPPAPGGGGVTPPVVIQREFLFNDWDTNALVFIDESVNGWDATNFPSMAAGASRVDPGGTNPCVDFDGIDDYCVISSNAVPFNFNKYTVRMWVNQDALAAADLFGFWTPSVGNVFAIELQAASSYRVSVGGIGNRFRVINHAAGVWEHFVFVYDGTQATATDRGKGYINSVDQSANYAGTIPTTIPDINASGTEFRLGFSTVSAPAGYYSGLVDGLVVDSNAWSLAEIQADYALGRP